MSARPKFTIEDVKRLIPEAKINEDGTIALGGYERSWEALLTTRRQLEIAQETLKEIDKGFYCHRLRIHDAQVKIRKSLDAINKEGEL